MVDTYVGVVTQESISCGTLLGPLPLSTGSPDTLTILIWKCIDKIPSSRQVLKATLAEQNSCRSGGKIPSWIGHVQPARHPDEQTLEVVAKGGQLYYRAQRDILDGEELKAWFGQDLADLLRLPLLPPTSAEEEKHFECVLCQEKFENPFPFIAHLMYRCQRRESEFTVYHQVRKMRGRRVKNFDIATLTDMDDNKKDWENSSSSPLDVWTVTDAVKKREISHQDNKDTQPKKRRKKSDYDDSPSIVHKKPKAMLKAENEIALEISESRTEKDKLNITFNAQVSAFKITDAQNSFGGFNGSDNESTSDTRGTSAFKKVDKSSFSHVTSFTSNLNSMSNLISSSLSHRELIFQSSSNFPSFTYQIPPPVSSPLPSSLPQSMVSSIPHPVLAAQSGGTDMHLTNVFGSSTKFPPALTALSSQSMKMNEDFKMLRQLPADNGFDLSPSASGLRLPAMPAMNYVNKPVQAMDSFSSKAFPTPLLPFLPPSLAALSFPTQNWCAKCNASFRMTSDLVYHMRSHHKRETDPQKMKREEKLKCHICHESFRERHHLTRHMTSHQ